MDLSFQLKKGSMVRISDLKGETVAFCASGGLDSCTITHWLATHGVNVVAVTADLGQPDEADVHRVADRMLQCGAAEAIVIPRRAEVAEIGIEAIQGQARYEGPYWNVCSLGRQVTVRGVIREAVSRGIRVLSHGATGRGNDQLRFQVATNLLRPDLSVYAPWRDHEFLDAFGGREQMIAYCQRNGLPIKDPRAATYSTDSNLLGLTHEAGELESLSTAAHFVVPLMGVRPLDAPEEPRRVAIGFEAGRPVSLDGIRFNDPVGLFAHANALAGAHAVGLNVHMVENRFVGVKSRGVYETPGMELLGGTYAMLLQLLLDRRGRDLFESCSTYLGRQLYEGFWFALGAQMARAAIGPVTRLATGTIVVDLFKGAMTFVEAADVPHSLYVPENSTMGAGGEFDHADSEGFTRVVGLAARVAAARGHVQNAI